MASALHRLSWRRTATVVCALSCAAGAAQAQTVPPPGVPLTLDQVLEIAEVRSEAIAIARTAIGRAEGEQVRARSGLFPQLSLSGGYDRALASEFSGLFNGNNTLFGGSGTAASGDTTENDSLSELPFGRANTWRVGVSVSQNIYSGGRLGAQQQIAAVSHESAGLAVTTARAQALLDVTQAYYDAVLSDRLVSIAGATLDQASATLQQTQAGFSAGTQPEFDVLRARVTRDNQMPLLIRQRVNRDVALLRLKQLLDLPATYDLRLADALMDEALPPPPVFAGRVADVERAVVSLRPAAVSLPGDLPLPARVAVSEAEATLRLREASLRLAEAQRNPSVSLNSTYSRVAYPSGVVPVFDRTNWTIGASVQLPLLTGGRQRGDELVARADVEQSRLQLQQTQELAALDTRSAWAELVAARAAWEASAGTVQQATRAYDIADVRYQAGVSTQLELSDSRLLLQQAEANRAQAARDLQMARARVALLPELPVGAGGSGTPRAPLPQLPQTPAPVPQPQGGGSIRTASVPGTQFTGTR